MRVKYLYLIFLIDVLMLLLITEAKRYGGHFSPRFSSRYRKYHKPYHRGLRLQKYPKYGYYMYKYGDRLYHENSSAKLSTYKIFTTITIITVIIMNIIR